MNIKHIQVDSLDHVAPFAIYEAAIDYVWEFCNDFEQAQKDLALFSREAERDGVIDVFEIVEIKGEVAQ